MTWPWRRCRHAHGRLDLGKLVTAPGKPARDNSMLTLFGHRVQLLRLFSRGEAEVDDRDRCMVLPADHGPEDSFAERSVEDYGRDSQCAS